MNQSLICSVSSTNVVAFTTETDIEDNSIRTWGSHVYVADLNSPWQVHKYVIIAIPKVFFTFLNFNFRILSNGVPVTILQWDLTGDLLLVADESGCVRIYKTKDNVLNDWQLALQTVLQGEHILAAAFFHSGKKVSWYNFLYENLCVFNESWL